MAEVIAEQEMVEVTIRVSPQLLADMDNPRLIEVLGQACVDQARDILQHRGPSNA
jgi:hypothetical protein